MTPVELLPKVRARSILDAVQHYPCALRISSIIPGHRCSGQDTVVGAHLPTIGKGVNTKVSDILVAAACDNCHSLLDGRDNRIHWIIANYPTIFYERLMRGHHETMGRWVEDGLLSVEGMEVV